MGIVVGLTFLFGATGRGPVRTDVERPGQAVGANAEADHGAFSARRQLNEDLAGQGGERAVVRRTLDGFLDRARRLVKIVRSEFEEQLATQRSTGSVASGMQDVTTTAA